MNVPKQELDALTRAIICEQENKKLMESIEDEIAYNYRQLTRLTGLKAILTR